MLLAPYVAAQAFQYCWASSLMKGRIISLFLLQSCRRKWHGRGIETGDLVGTLTRQHQKKLFIVWDVEMQSCHSHLGTRLIGIWEGGHHLSETHTNRFTTACASSSPSSSFLPTVSLSLSPGRKLPPENMTHFTGGQSLLKQNTRREEEMLCVWERVILFHLNCKASSEGERGYHMNLCIYSSTCMLPRPPVQLLKVLERKEEKRASR